MFIDITEIQQALGWQPHASSEEGVNAFFTQMDMFKEAPLWNEDSIAAATATWFKQSAPRTYS